MIYIDPADTTPSIQRPRNDGGNEEGGGGRGERDDDRLNNELSEQEAPLWPFAPEPHHHASLVWPSLDGEIALPPIQDASCLWIADFRAANRVSPEEIMVALLYDHSYSKGHPIIYLDKRFDPFSVQVAKSWIGRAKVLRPLLDWVVAHGPSLPPVRQPIDTFFFDPFPACFDRVRQICYHVEYGPTDIEVAKIKPPPEPKVAKKRKREKCDGTAMYGQPEGEDNAKFVD